MHLSLLGRMEDHGTIKTQLFKGAIIFFFLAKCYYLSKWHFY